MPLDQSVKIKVFVNKISVQIKVKHFSILLNLTTINYSFHRNNQLEVVFSSLKFKSNKYIINELTNKYLPSTPLRFYTLSDFNHILV